MSKKKERKMKSCARLLGEPSNLSVNVTAVQETQFISAADARVLEDDFVVLSTLGGRCSAGVTLLIGHSLNVDVDLVFGDDEGRLVITDAAVKSFTFRFMRPINLVRDALFFSSWSRPSAIRSEYV